MNDAPNATASGPDSGDTSASTVPRDEIEVLRHLVEATVRTTGARPMPDEPRRVQVFKLFAERAAAELERTRLVNLLLASEQQFRDLFDEAPIPYVYEDTDTRFVRANRAFMSLLGLAPGDVPGTMGLSLVAPTQEAQERVHHSLAAEQEGRQLDVIELELRRKDNGQRRRPCGRSPRARPATDSRWKRTSAASSSRRWRRPRG